MHEYCDGAPESGAIFRVLVTNQALYRRTSFGVEGASYHKVWLPMVSHSARLRLW